MLATIAAETAAAVERARLIQRVGHKRRLEAIGEVSAGVAHELRNPLFGISSAAQLLRFRVKDDPVVEKNVGRILREVERLNSMVTSLLEYGRPSPIRLETGDPDDVWDEVLEKQRGLLESRAILLERTRAARTACAIDAQQLAQVFVNLLANATDAAPEGSDLTLHVERSAHGHVALPPAERRRGHPPGRPPARVRDLLLHQAGRHGDRPPALPAHHRGARRHHLPRECPRARHDGHRRAPARERVIAAHGRASAAPPSARSGTMVSSICTNTYDQRAELARDSRAPRRRAVAERAPPARRAGRNVIACRPVARHCRARRVTRTLSTRFVVGEGAPTNGARMVVNGDGAARERR